MRTGTILAGFVAMIAALAVVIWISNLGRQMPVEEPDLVANSPADGVHDSNPFDDYAPPDPPPRAEIETLTYDFGRMAVGETQTHIFVVRNVGEGVLKLARGISTCKCTVGTLGQNEVAPGESAEIALTWEALAPSASFRQAAIIYTNDPDPSMRELSLQVHGMHANWIKSFPSDTWRSAAVSETSETAFEFVVASQLAESFAITGIETSSEFIDLDEDDITPIPEDELAQYHSALSGYRINGRLRAGFPVGEIHEFLIVSTDLEQTPRVRLSIESQRMGPFLVVGPGWQASEKLLQMGRFDAAAGKTTRFSLFVEEDGSGFQFTDVTVDPPVVDVTWEEDDTFDSQTRRRIHVEVTAAPGMPPGRWVREEPIHVTLSTNHPDTSEWEFFVSLQAN